ncbi:MAG: YcxB family protein [Verrucomicrobiales bacterium]|nr:YcxB family protein [Verrucomicrobiales bacterium]
MRQVYQISERDFVLGLQAHFGGKLIFVHIGFAILMATVVGGYWYSHRFCPYPVSLIFAGLAVVSPVLAFVASRLGAKRAWKILYAKEPGYQSDHVVELENDTISFRNKRGSTSIARDAIYAYRETDKYFMIYENPKRFHFVPKSNFDETGVAQFREFLAG